jgi:hypothetical protein
MSDWNFAIYTWVAVLMQLAAMLASCGFAWSGVQIILEASIADNPHIVPSVLYRLVGIIAALFIIFQAPALVNQLQGLFRVPLVP